LLTQLCRESLGQTCDLGRGSELVALKDRVDVEVEPLLFGKRAKSFLDESQLVEVVLPRKERIALDHFCEDTSQGPDVDLLRILLSD
jgi:hypothetical protein